MMEYFCALVKLNLQNGSQPDLGHRPWFAKPFSRNFKLINSDRKQAGGCRWGWRRKRGAQGGWKVETAKDTRLLGVMDMFIMLAVLQFQVNTCYWTKNVCSTACHHKNQTCETDSGVKERDFIQVLHDLREWQTPISKPLSSAKPRQKAMSRIPAPI